MGNVIGFALFFAFVTFAIKALMTLDEEYVLEEIRQSNGAFSQREIPALYRNHWSDTQPQAALATDLIAILYGQTSVGERLEVVEYFGSRTKKMCYNFENGSVRKGKKILKYGTRKHEMAFELLGVVHDGLHT